jgi:unsaturated chondroitin disaccharide hydrolase
MRKAQPGVAAVPRTILVRGERLAESKRRLAVGDTSLTPTFVVLIDSARAALASTPLSVMQKKKIPPSGDKHDYMSMAPYWWPDPGKPNGLPFIRRDGEVYPESRTDHDGTRLQKTVARVEDLALAHYFTGDARYSNGASKLLHVFFLDTATRMNPNLRYAQAVLGVNDGRGTGIIDTRTLPDLVDALRLLEGAPGWSAADEQAMVAWAKAYLGWMLESANGREERAALNNHGTFYDAQIASLALFVGDSVLARKTLDDDAKARIGSQIKPDGQQPLELERTRPLHYSVFNLDAFTMLAEMSRHVGVDLWDYKAPSGGSIGAALRFVAPYADAALKFPATDVTLVGADVFLPPLRRASAALDDTSFAVALQRLPPDARRKDFSRFSFPATALRFVLLDAFSDSVLARVALQLRRTATALDPTAGYPRATKPDGNWEQRAANQWTSGFFAGTLWYMYQNTHAPEWRQLAERWTAGLEANKRITTTHDLGFMIFNSFGHGYLLTGDPHYRDVVMEASRSLATRYSPVVGAIKSWDLENATDARHGWKYPVIIDNLMNLELLFWAGSHGGDSAWSRLAERHALTSARAHVRADGSTAHVALFDPGMGTLERTTTWQGYADTSAWARGQAWAIHGLSAAYGRTRRPDLLQAAQRAADWFIAHLPADGVPYWDFRHPDIPNTERDASAAAIAASGLYDLARRSDAQSAERYRAAADRLLESLASHYLAPPTPAGAILAHSTGGRPQHAEIDVGLTYADYYFVEALLRRKGQFLE